MKAMKRRLNGYATTCTDCSRRVPAQGGVLRNLAGPYEAPRWAAICYDCENPRRVVLSDTVRADFTVPGTHFSELFHHQRQVAELAARTTGGLRLLLADEPGLGKTATALVATTAVGAQRTVVVVPAAVRINWAREAGRWLIDPTVVTLTGRKPDAEQLPDSGLVIIGFDTLKAWSEVLEAWAPDALIVDEAHRVKNPAAARTKAVAALADGIRDRDGSILLLTGTPVVNKASELIPAIEMLGRLDDFGGSRPEFRKRYAQVLDNGYGLQELDGTSGQLHNLSEHLTRSCLIRRRKSEILDMPDVLLNDVAIENTGENADLRKAVDALHARLLEDGSLKALLASYRMTDWTMLVSHVDALTRGGGVAFAEIARVRLAIGLAKVEAAASIAADAKDSGAPRVVFVHHREVGDLLEERLLEEDARVAFLRGGQSDDERQAVIDAFQKGDLDVAIASIQAAGVGITLTRSRDVTFVELPWTAADQRQAIDRVHRIGQTGSVTAERLIVASSLDGRMADAIDRKARLAAAILDGDGELAVDSPATPMAEAVAADLVERRFDLLRLERPAQAA